MARQIDRVPSTKVALDGEQEKRFARLMESLVLIDLHQHPMVLPEDFRDFTSYCLSKTYTWGYEAVRHGGWTAVCTANIVSSLGRASELSFADFVDLTDEIALMLADIARQGDGVVQIRRTRDIVTSKERGRVGFIPTVEHLALGHEIHRVDVLHGMGILLAGLTYSRKTFLGDGQAERVDGGMSELGAAVVRRMNDVGMVIDLSHAGARTALDAIAASQAPCVFSHNAAHAVWPSERTRKDEELVACAAKGGVVAVIAVPNLLSNDTQQDISCVLDHYDYLVKRLGIDHVAIGTDTLIGDQVGLQRHMSKGTPRSLPAPYLDGIESPADGTNIVRGLITRGYSDAEIRKIAGENVLRVFAQVIG